MNPLVSVNNQSKFSPVENKRENTSVGNVQGRALSPEKQLSSRPRPTREMTEKFLAGLQRSPNNEKPPLPLSSTKEQRKEVKTSPPSKKLSDISFPSTDKSSPPKPSLRGRAKTDLSPVQKSKAEEIKISSFSLPIAVPLKLSSDTMVTSPVGSPTESKPQKGKAWSFLKKSSSSPSDEFVIERKETPPLSTTPEIEKKATQCQPTYELTYKELNETEITFNSRLKTLIECQKKLGNEENKNFFDFIDETKGTEKEPKISRDGLKEQGKNVLDNLFIQVHFANDFSNSLLEKLKNTSTFKEKINALRNVNFNAFESIVKSYEAYTKFQKKLSESERDEFFKKTDNLIPLDDRFTKLNFEGFAANLMQRLVRYEMLINQLLKEVEKDPALVEEREILKAASEKVHEATKKSNSTLRLSIQVSQLDLARYLKEETRSPKSSKISNLARFLLSLSTSSLNSSSSSL